MESCSATKTERYKNWWNQFQFGFPRFKYFCLLITEFYSVEKLKRKGEKSKIDE